MIVPALLAVALIAAAVVLAQPPTASVDVVGPTGNTCGVYNFNSTSSDPDNDIVSFAWSGAATGTTASTQATFGTPGQRSVTLTVRDAAGGDDTTEDESSTTQTIDVVNDGPPNAAISTSLANPVQPNTAVTVSAAGSADTGNGSIVSYAFDLNGDNVFETNNGTNQATVTFPAGAPESHTVRVRVTDNCNVTDTAVTSVLVQNTPATGSFTFAPNPGVIGAPMTFTATGSADTTRYQWSFDGDDSAFEFDGAGSATTTHTFDAPGVYLVHLRVSDAEGAGTVSNRLVRVNAKPTPSFVATPNPALIGETVSFDPSSSGDSDGTIATYQWDLDGNGTFETLQAAGAAPPTRAYPAAGTVTVTLRVTDNNGAFNDISRPVVVQSTRPRPSFAYTPHDPLPNQAVTLTSTSAPSASPAAPAIESTQWDFGFNLLADFALDGIGSSIVTSFATPGPHTVAVKVIETGGGFAIATDTIVVNTAPQSSFTVSPAKPVEGRQVTLASTSTDAEGPLAKQEWDLNRDGTFERSGPVITTSALKAGTRTIALRVTDSKGAQAVSSQPIKVARKPLGPPVDVKRRIGFRAKSWGIELVVLMIKVPSRTTVKVKCSGRGCPRGTFTKRTRKKGGTLVFDKLRGSVRAGGKITVLTSRAGRITAFDTYTVRGGGKGPLLREGCKLPGKKKPQRCPRT